MVNPDVMPASTSAISPTDSSLSATAATTPTGPMATTPQDTAEDPNPWTIINDYTKTIITLASAMLAVTITFSGQILTVGATSLQRGFLGGAWFCLVVTILSGVIAEASLTTFLRRKVKTCNRCLAASLVAMWSLIFAAVLFFLCAVVQLTKDQTGMASAAQAATQTVDSIAKIPAARWNVISAIFDSSANRYNFQMTEETTKSRYEVISDATTARVISHKRVYP